MPTRKATQKDIERIAQWKRENTDRIVIDARKEYHIPDRIAAAIKDGHAASRQDFIVSATLDALNRLGYAAPADDQPQE